MGQEQNPTMREMMEVLAEARVNFSPNERKSYVLKFIAQELRTYEFISTLEGKE